MTESFFRLFSPLVGDDPGLSDICEVMYLPGLCYLKNLQHEQVQFRIWAITISSSVIAPGNATKLLFKPPVLPADL